MGIYDTINVPQPTTGRVGDPDNFRQPIDICWQKMGGHMQGFIRFVMFIMQRTQIVRIG